VNHLRYTCRKGSTRATAGASAWRWQAAATPVRLQLQILARTAFVPWEYLQYQHGSTCAADGTAVLCPALRLPLLRRNLDCPEKKASFLAPSPTPSSLDSQLCAAPPVMAPAPRDNPAKQSGGCQHLPEVSEWREARRSRPAAAFAASEPQAGTKRQRLVAAGTRQSPRTAKAAAAGEAAQAWGPPAELACAVAAAAAAAADFGSAGKRVQGAQAVCQQQLLQPPRVVDQAGQGQLPQSPAHAAASTHPQQRLAELQAALQQQQVAAAAREQLISDLQRANSQLQAQCAQWEGLARDRQASELGVQAAAQQHSVQVGTADT
jgi:hypothetical protein